MRRTPTEIEDRVVAEYLAGDSLLEIAERYGIHTKTVKEIRQRRGVPDRGRAGILHPRWSGGRGTDSKGYVEVWVDPDDPIAVAMAPKPGRNGKPRRVKEHRLVMAHYLGRPLLRTETVHHINGVRSDNRIENLQLRQGQHGPGTVFVCSDCGSQNVHKKELS